jgi:UDP-3-O-[3-hydroxymyristoyl] glucosamine N-acyltransferase
MNKHTLSLTEVVAHLGPLVSGQSWSTTTPDEALKFRAVNAPDLADAGDLIFVSNSKHIKRALESKAKALCVHDSMRLEGELFASRGPDRFVFYSPEPERAMRETIQKFFLQTPYINRDDNALIHPTAVIHPTAEIGAGTRIGPYAIIASQAKIGAESVIASHVVIESRAEIGSGTVVHPFVYIGHDCLVGKECEIHPHSVVGKEGFGYAHDLKGQHYRIPHQGIVVLEDRVHLGSTVTIDRGTFGETRVGRGAILDNRIHIAHNVSIGAGSIITAGFNVAGSTKIGKHFVTGGNASVTGHIEICDGVQLAGVSVVRKSIDKPGAYGGNPLLPMRDFMRMNLALSKLPSLLKKAGLLKDERNRSPEGEN